MTTANIQKIETKGIRVDMGTQTREAVDESVVQEYAEAMEAGAVFPPIVVFYVEAQGEYVLADGYHRLLAHCRVWPDQPIAAEVLKGNLYDAQWYSFGANKSHGLRRTPDDKRKAVRAALLHLNGANLSDRKIAKHVGVSHTFVANCREKLESTGNVASESTRTGRDGRTINTSNIGSQPDPDADDGPQRICNECDHYDDLATYCSVKKQLQRPWEHVCDKYRPRRSRSSKPKDRPVFPNRRMKGAVEIYLPPDNPQLAAVELRECFPLDYLRSVFSALEAIEGGDCAA